LGRDGIGNIEWIETGLKAALFTDACVLLSELFSDPEIEIDGDEKRPGEKLGGTHERTILSLFGEVSLRRNYYYDPTGKAGRYPMDEALGLENRYTPGTVRLICRAAESSRTAIISLTRKILKNHPLSAFLRDSYEN